MIGGGIWPVVQRELRGGARRPFNHWLRVAGALGGVIIFAVSVWNTPITNVGGQIFLGVHQLMILLILCIVPAITADSIARERREGTLGLLFLTPLRSWEIVIGKVVVQVLKLMTLWLAVIPMLTIPFVTGGVTPRILASHLGVELCAGMLCLAAGILATSLTDKRATAFAVAFALAAALVFGLTEERWWNVLRLRPASAGYTTVQFQVLQGRLPAGAFAGGFTGPFLTPFNPALGRFSPPIRTFITTAPRPAVILWPLACRLLLASLILWLAIRFAGLCVERSWQDKIPTLGQTNWAKFCGAPVFQEPFQRRMRETLEWNPIAWLQQYSWKARLTKWGLCLAFTALVCMASTARNFDGIADRELLVLAVLAAAYTYAGVNGFLQEKKNGALELILVTPLTIDEIIFGRVWGLWKQFFPAAFVLAACFYGLRLIWHYYVPDYGRLTFLIVGFFTLPFFATLAALRFRNIVLAAAVTWLALAGSSLAGAASILLVVYDPDVGSICFGVLIGQAILVILAFRNLRHSLAQRDYSF